MNVMSWTKLLPPFYDHSQYNLLSMHKFSDKAPKRFKYISGLLIKTYFSEYFNDYGLHTTNRISQHVIYLQEDQDSLPFFDWFQAFTTHWQ